MIEPDIRHDYYRELGVSSRASRAEILRKYRSLALKYHPDRNIGKEERCTSKFQTIQFAKEILEDPAIRAKYDADRRNAGLMSPASIGVASTSRAAPPKPFNVTPSPRSRTTRRNTSKGGLHSGWRSAAGPYNRYSACGPDDVNWKARVERTAATAQQKQRQQRSLRRQLNRDSGTNVYQSGIGLSEQGIRPLSSCSLRNRACRQDLNASADSIKHRMAESDTTKGSTNLDSNSLAGSYESPNSQIYSDHVHPHQAKNSEDSTSTSSHEMDMMDIDMTSVSPDLSSSAQAITPETTSLQHQSSAWYSSKDGALESDHGSTTPVSWISAVEEELRRETSSNLPFPVEASALHSPLLSEAKVLDFPKLPIPPDVTAHNTPEEAWRIYRESLKVYMKTISAYNGTMLDHLNSRKQSTAELEAKCSNEAINIGVEEWAEYMQTVHIERDIWRRWYFGRNRYAEGIKNFINVQKDAANRQ